MSIRALARKMASSGLVFTMMSMIRRDILPTVMEQDPGLFISTIGTGIHWIVGWINKKGFYGSE